MPIQPEEESDGMAVENTGGPLQAPLGKGVLSRMFDVFGNAIDREPELSALEERNVAARARRLERFLTQPFFTTEQFTGLKGKLVSLADALDGCGRILHDEFKDLPERALYMIGTIGETKSS